MNEGDRQFIEVVDDTARAEGFDRGVGIAEGDRDRRDAGIAGSQDVVDAVADHQCAPGVSAGFFDGPGEMSGIRLADRKCVSTGDRREVMCQTQLVNQGTRKFFHLVGADSQGETLCGKTLQCCDKSGVGAAFTRHAGLVVIDEVFKQGRQLCIVERHTPERESACDHHACALTDEVSEVAVADRRKVVDRDRVVQAGDEIRCCVDKCAVEIEDDGRLCHAEAPFA